MFVTYVEGSRTYLDGCHNGGLVDLLQVVVHGAGLRLEDILMCWAQFQLQQVSVVSVSIKECSNVIMLQGSSRCHAERLLTPAVLFLPLCRVAKYSCSTVMYHLNRIRHISRAQLGKVTASSPVGVDPLLRQQAAGSEAVLRLIQA